VAWVGGLMFAYELDRSLFEGEDCRFPTTLDDLPWKACPLTGAEQGAVRGFMEATGLRF